MHLGGIIARAVLYFKEKGVANLRLNRFRSLSRRFFVCLELTRDLCRPIRYETGDHVAVYPQNSSELVDRIGKALNVDLDTPFAFKAIESM